MIELPTDDNPVVIIHGDCLDILPQIPAGVVDAVVTDPPYGIGRDGKPKSTSSHGGHKGYQFKEWDKNTPPDSLLSKLARWPGGSIMWGANYYPQVLPPSPGWLFWDKGQRIDQADGELAYSSRNGALRVFTLNRCSLQNDGAVHPTQKPIALMRWCIQHLPKTTKVILDPFAGSGTTGVAAILEGRKAILIEKDAGYIEVIRKRIAETLGRPTTLANGRTVGRNLFESIRQESPCVRE